MVDLPQRPAPPRSPLDTIGRGVHAAVDRIQWFGIGRLVAVSCCVVAVGAGAFWLVRAPTPPVEASLPYASSSTAATSLPTSTPAPTSTPTTVAESAVDPAGEVVVHVAGAVVAPGVYRLEAGSRAIDAVLAAGGATADADPDAVNLAQVLRDGDRIVVPTVADAVELVPGISGSGGGEAGTTGGTDAGTEAPVDLNRAGVDELDALPGIGPATAAAIVAHRDEHGPFASVDDLADVRGIGPTKLDALRGLVTV